MGNNLEEVQGTAASFFKWLLKTAWAIFWNSRNLLINQETESAAGKLKLSNGDDLFQLGKGCQERFSGDRKSLPDFHWPLRNAYCPYSRDFVDHSLPALTRKCWSSRENTVPLGPHSCSIFRVSMGNSIRITSHDWTSRAKRSRTVLFQLY